MDSISFQDAGHNSLEVSSRTSPRRSLLMFGHRSDSGMYERTEGFSESSSPKFSRIKQRDSLKRYEVSETMNRLRASMVGEPPAQKIDRRRSQSKLANALGQVPAIALIAIFHLMIGIPFGVSYFPLSWSQYVEEATDAEGPFPLPGKEALGIRMFLFATVIGQVVFTLFSEFPNPIGLQMVENVPFCHELANIVIDHQGYGLDAISTLVVMFGLASVVVGVVFWVLGHYKLGRIVYFFPTHVLIGCIGGIGVFIAKTGLEVTMVDTFSIPSLFTHWTLLWPVFAFETILRVLEEITKDRHGKSKYTLLSPIYFCMITPIFYLGLVIANVSLEDAEERGYFFPRLDDDNVTSTSVWGDSHLWDMWAVIHFPTVSWKAIWASLPTLLALTLFSLIHVPINIPAFALSTNTEADMNNELMAHGYSNILAGLFGGLQNYMAYTQSVLYHKSGGTGRTSGVAVAVITSLLFFVGPTIASYIPRCMAGTLLLHVGLDLFMEGVWDSYGKFDLLEYSGIWLIVIVMTSNGMEAAMMAGVIAAVSTYAVQSVAYLSPIRGHMPATTLRSSQAIHRPHEAEVILNSSENGRSRILVVQLQGHLFFGNMANFTERMYQLLSTTPENDDMTNNATIGKSKDMSSPIVVIMDCSLVLGIDSSAAQAIAKFKDTMLNNYKVELCIFVTGSDQGFPTEFQLSDQLSSRQDENEDEDEDEHMNHLHEVHEETALLLQSIQTEEARTHNKNFSGSQVCDSLDMALIKAEDALLSRQDPSLLQEHDILNPLSTKYVGTTDNVADEREFALHTLRNLCPMASNEGLGLLFAKFERELYRKGDFIWKQNSPSDCVKLLVSGLLISELEQEAGTTEHVVKGNTIGEFGLVKGEARMSSVKCVSAEAVLYSMSQVVFEELVEQNPQIARYVDLICINYLALRVQHASNRIFETRCLPI